MLVQHTHTHTHTNTHGHTHLFIDAHAEVGLSLALVYSLLNYTKHAIVKNNDTIRATNLHRRKTFVVLVNVFCLCAKGEGVPSFRPTSARFLTKCYIMLVNSRKFSPAIPGYMVHTITSDVGNLRFPAIWYTLSLVMLVTCDSRLYGTHYH